MNVIRVLCADDHALVRKGIASILANEPDMRLVRRNLLRSLPGTDPAMVWLTGAARSVGASGWSVTKNLFSSVPILG